MDRREFFHCLATLSYTDQHIKTRKNAGSIKLQIEYIKQLWEIHKKVNANFWFNFPFWHEISGEWHSSFKTEILGMYKNLAIINQTELTLELESQFEFIRSNTIVLDKLPEAVNFNGIYTPAVELFRLDLPAEKIKNNDIELLNLNNVFPL